MPTLIDGSLQEDFNALVEKYADDIPGKFLSRRLVRGIMWDKSDGKCWYCGIEMNPFRDLSIDHVVPQSNGGTEEFDNLVPCCRKCNRSKSNSTLDRLRLTLAKREVGYPGFTHEQLDYLQTAGIDTDELLPANNYQFYFEREGLLMSEG